MAFIIMRKLIVTLTAMLTGFVMFGQDGLPGYPEVVRSFFDTYTVASDPESWLNFAKKKDGWYIQHINQIKNDQVQQEAPFWLIRNRQYEHVQEELRVEKKKDEIEIAIKEYLSSTASSSWNGYERCRYYGYTGWQYDLIKDFGMEQQLPDTLTEGLARAYSSVSNAYLWNQQGGGWMDKDTLFRPLGRTELPSPERIEKATLYINRAIETYGRLAKQNPAYITLVGNISLRQFNECMFGYMQMGMALQQQKATAYLQKIALDEQYILQAKNYLNSCDQNGILFTYGDNDTYQLWYVQQTQHFREDVAVINTSLLGLPIYIEMLKKNKSVSFTASSSFYSKKISDISYYKEKKGSKQSKFVYLNNFVQDILEQKDSIEYTNTEGESLLLGAYSTKRIKLPVKVPSFNKLSSFKTTVPFINFSLKQYLYINDLLMLDIINTNINTRPIYFTSNSTGFFDSNLMQKGIVFQLFPLSNTNRAEVTKQETRALEKYADSIYKPVISFKSKEAENISIDGNNVFFQLYAAIADYHKMLNHPAKAANWLEKASSSYPMISEKNMPGAYAFINVFVKINNDKVKEYCETYAGYLKRKYTYPTAKEGYLSREEYLHNLQGLRDLFQQEAIDPAKIDLLINNMKD